MTEAKTMRKTMTDKEKQRQITVIHSSAFMLIRSKSTKTTTEYYTTQYNYYIYKHIYYRTMEL